MKERVSLPVRVLLRLAEHLVPSHRRTAWRRQWDAELTHRMGVRPERRGLLRFALGSMAHALYVRREEGMMRGFFGDLAFTVRSLLRRPAFLVLSVATLGVGIGSTTAVFSIVEAVLLRELPLPDAQRLVGVFSTNPTLGMDRFSVSYPDYQDWTGRSDLFESAAAYVMTERDLSGDGVPERLFLARVGAGFFETLGASAAQGRLLANEDQDPGAERTIVISHQLWQRRFGGQPGVVGQTLRIDAVPHTVIGVASESQTWPTGVEAWIPLQYGTTPPSGARRRSNHSFQAVARLRPGVAASVASDQLRAMARAWYTANESGNEQGIEAMVIPLRATGPGGDAAPVLGILGAAVLLVLLIACMNQASLLLVNAWARSRELSLRAALGAGRARLMGLLLGESLILALLGAAAGLGVAWLGLQGFEAMTPQGASTDIVPRLNGLVVGGAVVLAVLASVLAGLAPAVRASRTSLAGALKEGGAAAGTGRSGVRIRRGLVILETTLSVVLLTGAGLAIRTFQAQVNADTGLEAAHVLIYDVRLPGARYGEEGLATLYYDQAVERLEAIPGVVSASATSSLPLGASRYNLYRVFLFEGAPEPPAGPDVGAMWVEVDPGYFETLGVEPVRGRAFTRDDDAGSAPVMMVNEAMAARMSPDQEIIGRRVRSWRDEDLLREVVGVLPDYQLTGMAGVDQPAVYVPRAQGDFRFLSFLVRIAGDPASMVAGVRSAMEELDPSIALEGLQTLREAHHEGLAGIRAMTVVFAIFGAMALVLAVSGVYGLVATSVEQRTREIGIRMALGGSRRSIRAQVLIEGAKLSLTGIVSGLVVAAGAGIVLSKAFMGLVGLDVRTLVGVVLLLSCAAVMASWIPAARATRVDPVRALRSE